MDGLGAGPSLPSQPLTQTSKTSPIETVPGQNGAAGGLAKEASMPQPPQLSLPKGGGSIQGMGEKFDVNLCTGTASANLPIQISTNRGELQPSLSLNYDSGAGNGPFGLGWNLSGISTITRKTSKGLPLYRDFGSDGGSDVFLLSGSEDLVPAMKRDAHGDIVVGSNGFPLFEETLVDGYLVRQYYPRVAQSFSRIERWTNAGDSSDIHWRILNGQNQTTIFGRDNTSRIYDPVAADGGSLRIFSWLQAETYDPFGNAVIFNYKAEDSTNVNISQANEANRRVITRTANRYLKSVQYGNTLPNRTKDNWIPTSAFGLPSDTWKFSIVLDYGEHNYDNPKPDDTGLWHCRLDPFSVFNSGFEVRTYRLCQRILMFHHFQELNTKDCLVGSTELEYNANPAVTYLVSGQRVGYSVDNTGNIAAKKVLPTVAFEYSLFPTDDELGRLSVEEVDPSSMENLPVGLDSKKYQWIDLDGEGLPGILTAQECAWYYKRNTSANNFENSENSSSDASNTSDVVRARFEEMEVITSIPSLSAVGSNMTFGDVDGSGNLDLIQTAPSSWGYYKRESECESGWQSYQSFAQFPSIDVTQPGIKFLDLTGDGLPDILIFADKVYCWYPSLAGCGYGPGSLLTQPSNENMGPICVFSDVEQTIYIADMSGDGLADIVRIRNSDICYWPNCGYGNFGSLVRMDNAPCFDNSDIFNQNRIRLADIDGSGTTDIIYLDSSGIDIYLNQSGNSFASRKRVYSFPPIDNSTIVDAIDLLGNGTTCLVWSSPMSWASRSPLAYIDLMRGKKPHMLTKAINNLGTETMIYYAPSTKFYLQDKEAGMQWMTRLPFPVHCVEKVEVMDNISKNIFVKRYSYHEGYFDGIEREFRGFAMVEEWDSETYTDQVKTNSTNIDTSWHVPPIHTKTWFHTGIFTQVDKISRHMAYQYFGAPDQTDEQAMESFYNSLLPDTLAPSTPLEAGAMREACRALKAHILRSEVYADDGSSKATIPYSVQESNYTIEVLQPLQDAHYHSVFTVFPRETISFSYERSTDDPRIHHEMTLQVDNYGSILKSLKIAYGRLPGKSSLAGPDKLKQETTLFLYSENDVTSLLSTSNDYRLPVAYETRTYELSGFQLSAGSSRFSLLDFAIDQFAPLLSLTEIPYEQPNITSLRQKRLIGCSRSYFRKDDLSGLLPAGKCESLALPGSQYSLCFTPGLVTGVFKRQVDGGPTENLIPDPKTILGGTDDQQGGYIDLDQNGSWWKPGGQIFFHQDPTVPAVEELSEARKHFFQPAAFMDAFKNVSTVTYDPYSLLPVSTVDQVGNVITVIINYRTLAAELITDANNNQSAVAYDALGLVAGTAAMGKPGENQGDSLANFNPDISQADIDEFFADPKGSKGLALLGGATSRNVYDIGRYQRDPIKNLPSYSASISRESHASDPTPPGGLKTQISFSYSDGFSRVIQAKGQSNSGPLTEDGPNVLKRWIGSGWTIYNNKGQPVRKYEPFFDDTHDFKDNMAIGASPIIMYDALSRVVATVLPNHTLEKTVFDSWLQTYYDGNDNVKISNPENDPDIGPFFYSLPISDYLPSWYDARIGGQLGADEKAAAMKTEAHFNTPQVSHFDVLGRSFLTIQDNGGGKKYSTRINFDIKGNKLDLMDANNRLVSKVDFNISGETIHQTSMEAGEKWTLFDVLGHPFLSWNSRNFRFRTKYDSARRQIESWVRQGTANEILYHQITYGESATDAQVHNLRTKVYAVRDQAGEAFSSEYDFKGNLLSSVRQLAIDYKATLDWSQLVELNTNTYTSTTSYDALNRPIKIVAPDMSVIIATYNESGIIDQKVVNVRGQQSSGDPSTWSKIFTKVDCNPKYQPTRVYYANGTVTNWTYDPLLYRLARVQTTRPSGTVQDLNYFYDPVGNIASIQDKAQQSIYFRNNRIDPNCTYTYDPLYRLINATGREHLGQANAPIVPSSVDFNNGSSPSDGNAMASYTESYLYDSVGNILSVKHAGDDAQTPGWTRTYSYNEQSQLEPGKMSNRLSFTTIGANTERYTYDIHGNITSMPQIPLIQWDFRDQLYATSKQKVQNGGTPETTYYVYDSGKSRARKVTERQAGPGTAPTRLNETLYLASLEEFSMYDGDGTTISLDRQTLHIDNGKKCSLLVETTKRSDSTPSTLFRYQYGNRSGSVTLELDDNAQIITYEEYSPYGNTTYQAVRSQTEAPKVYRYNQKERDTETGLYHYGARYYICWLGRWLSCDPGGLIDGPNIYQYARSNPSSFTDPTGLEAVHQEVATAGSAKEFNGTESVSELHRRARLAHWDFKGTPTWNGTQWVAKDAYWLPKNTGGGKGVGATAPGPKKEAAGDGGSSQAPSPGSAPDKAPAPAPAPSGSGQGAEAGSGMNPVLKSFAYGVVEGAAAAVGGALLVAGVVALGAPLAVVGTGVALLGALGAGVTIGELITGEDLSGKKLSTADKANMIGQVVGAAAVGGLIKGALGGAGGEAAESLGEIKPPPEILEAPKPPEVPPETTDRQEFLGSRRAPLKNAKSGLKPKTTITRNQAGEVNGRQYYDHAFDSMQNRGIMPSVVENTIAEGIQLENRPGRPMYYDASNDVIVVLKGQTVVTTFYPDDPLFFLNHPPILP